jgi:very-short-patch-repair endonuclease
MRSPSTRNLARRLRRTMSRPEVLIWVRLRERSEDAPVFRRQHPVGPYVADFFCAAARLVVEVDGAIHAEEAQRRHDERRDAYLRGLGLRVIRVTGAEVMADPDTCTDGIVRTALAMMNAG